MDEEIGAPPSIWAIVLLGLSGFPIAAMAYAYGPPSMSGHGLNVLITWSAVMLGFLGGIRWGLESGRKAPPRWPRLALSALFPIGGWALLAARGDIPVEWILTGYIAAYILQWLFDHSAPDTPTRYPRLMTVLTLGACVSLAMALEKALRM